MGTLAEAQELLNTMDSGRRLRTPTEADALIQQQVVNLIPSLCQGLVP
jgi:hypothetical protein